MVGLFEQPLYDYGALEADWFICAAYGFTNVYGEPIANLNRRNTNRYTDADRYTNAYENRRGKYTYFNFYLNAHGNRHGQYAYPYLHPNAHDNGYANDAYTDLYTHCDKNADRHTDNACPVPIS